jgi:hypothetical protein
MTVDTYDAEFIRSAVTATKRGAGLKVEEPARRRGYGMGNYVFAPTLAIGFIVYFGVFGACLTILAAVHLWLGSTDDRAWLIVFGLPWVFASRAALVRFNYQLDEYNDLQWRVKRFKIEPGEDLQWRVKRFKIEPGEEADTPTQIERVDDSHLIGLRAPWIFGWQSQLASKVFRRTGEWKAGKSIARERHLKGLYTDLTGNYAKAKDDLRRLGWLAGDDWTDKAKDELRKRLPVAAPTPDRGT